MTTAKYRNQGIHNRNRTNQVARTSLGLGREALPGESSASGLSRVRNFSPSRLERDGVSGSLVGGVLTASAMHSSFGADQDDVEERPLVPLGRACPQKGRLSPEER